MIIFSIILCLDNVCRIIPFKDGNNSIFTVMEYIQTFLLVFFDKLILATISMQAVIYYLGIVKTTFYYAHETAIFTISLIISLVISSALSGTYIYLFGLVCGEIYCYCDDDEFIKRYTDTAFNSIYGLINFFCIGSSLCYSWSKRKETSNDDIQYFDYKHHFRKTLLMFLLNNWAFILSFLIVYDKIEVSMIDVIYLITCLAISLLNSINRTVWKETKKIFCKKKSNNRNDSQHKSLKSSGENEENRTESY
jgi:hypothetical protein